MTDLKRHIIIGHFGSSDKYTVNAKSDETALDIDFLDRTNKLKYDIDLAIKELKKVEIFPSETGLDLLILAILVYAADTRVSRMNSAQDSWTREIKLIVPVTNPTLWNIASSVIIKMLNFLTGDLWDLQFRVLPRAHMRMLENPTTSLFDSPFNVLTLFSGGLDSLIHTINLMEKGLNPLLISHAGDGLTSKIQDKTYERIKKKYEKMDLTRLRLWVVAEKGRKIIPETSTRSRSFLFFAIGIFAVTGLGSQFVLEAPENGMIALNVPLDVMRLGSLSTRTTHPYYISQWNKLLTLLGIKGQIINPYWNKTKGEMALECLNQDALKLIAPISMSCSSPGKNRWKNIRPQHCGYCLPCIIRQAALLKMGKDFDKTKYAINLSKKKKLVSTKAEGAQVRSFQYAIHKLKGNADLAKYYIHLPGPLNDDPSKWEELAAVYSRGLDEVDQLISIIKTIPKS